MRIFVTGLCLQGNKGGPAIALALKAQLDKYLENVSYVFSVPQEDEFPYEQKQAEVYDVDVVEDFSYRDCISPFAFNNFAKRKERLKKWRQTLGSADLVIEMSAISYAGPPLNSSFSVLMSARVRYYLAARLFHKKLLAWTQSYGPFSTPLTRLLSKWDLGRQPAVFCRGKNSQKNVKQLLPGKKTYCFPDVATLLDFDKDWGTHYAKNLFPADFDFNRLITISPSAVIYTKTKRKNGDAAHIKNLLHLCNHLLEKGYAILLVPHTFRPRRHYPEICDYAVSRIIFDRLKSNNPKSNVSIVRDDLSPMRLKSIIATAAVHVGARYHSLIASLSSGVPSISLSWHHKYGDLMAQYQTEEYVFSEIERAQPSRLTLMLDHVIEKSEQIITNLKRQQKNISLQVEENTKLFVELINLQAERKENGS